MVFLSEKTVEVMRKTYPAGTRVRLVHMNDSQSPDVGTLGTVIEVDDSGAIRVKWDSGSILSVILSEDNIEICN